MVACSCWGHGDGEQMIPIQCEAHNNALYTGLYGLISPKPSIAYQLIVEKRMAEASLTSYLYRGYSSTYDLAMCSSQSPFK